jgi:hypothetical protein
MGMQVDVGIEVIIGGTGKARPHAAAEQWLAMGWREGQGSAEHGRGGRPCHRHEALLVYWIFNQYREESKPRQLGT